MKYILQHDMRDCGATCLAMVTDYYGLKLSIAQCRELTKTDRNGTTIYGIVDGASRVGLKAEALTGDAEELLECIHNGQIEYPFIAHVITEDNMLHFVVILDLKNEQFIIAICI